MSVPIIKRAEQQISPAAPVITFGLLVLCLWSMYELSVHGMLWVKMHSFSPSLFASGQNSLPSNLLMMFWATVCQYNFWHFFGNCYFIMVFGSTLETRLGPLRYLLLVLLSMFGGWLILGQETGAGTAIRYVGPGLLTTGLVGAYLNFFQEKKISPGGSLVRTHRIFHEKRDPNPAESFGISPWIIVLAFVIFQVAMHFVVSRSPLNLDTLRLLPALAVLVIGLVTCTVLILAATSHIEGNPLKRLAVQRYQQLLALDMTHEQAVQGAARLLSLPPEQVRNWISKGGGPLPQA